MLRGGVIEIMNMTNVIKKEKMIKKIENFFGILACVSFVISLICTYFHGAVAMLIGVPVMVACIWGGSTLARKLADKKFDGN